MEQTIKQKVFPRIFTVLLILCTCFNFSLTETRAGDHHSSSSTTGTMYFYIVDGTNTSRKLSNAEVKLYDNYAGTTVTSYSNTNGLVSFSNMVVGRTYTITAAKTEGNYQYSNSYSLYFSSGCCSSSSTIALKRTTIPSQSGTVKIVKTDKATGAALAGAVFELTDSVTGTKYNLTTASDGIATMGSLTLNRTYSIKEIVAPSGYVLDSSASTICIQTSGQTVTVNRTNSKEECCSSKLKVVKVDQTTWARLPGAVFEITDKVSGKIYTVTTDSNGVAEVNNLPTGRSYTIEEITAPSGYVRNSTIRVVTLDEDCCCGSTVQVTITNKAEVKTGSIKIIKKDAATGALLAGAVFTVEDTATGNTQTVTTDSTGIAIINELPVGREYIVKEIESPNGYILDSTQRSITLTEADANQTISLIVENEPEVKTGSIRIIKKDKVSGKVLSGAEFEIKDTITGEVKTVTTDADGIAIITELPIERSYEIKETIAPTGYELDETVKAVTLTKADADKTIDLIVDNQPIGTIRISKVDKETGGVLAGAVFDLYNEAGEKVGSGKTNANGVLRFHDLPLGKYIIRETAAPAGYDLITEDITVELTNAGKTVLVTVENQKTPATGSIKIIKKDASTQELLSGAVFEVKDMETGEVKTITIGADGTAIISGLAVEHIYEIKEITAPAGYVLDDTVKTVILTENDADKTVEVEVENYKEPVSAMLTVTKVDKDDHTIKLPGAIFAVYDSDRKRIGIMHDNGDGTYTLEGLQAGVYYTIEVYAPEDYVTTAEEYKFWVEEGQTLVELVIENEKIIGK